MCKKKKASKTGGVHTRYILLPKSTLTEFSRTDPYSILALQDPLVLAFLPVQPTDLEVLNLSLLEECTGKKPMLKMPLRVEIVKSRAKII